MHILRDEETLKKIQRDNIQKKPKLFYLGEKVFRK